MANRDDETKLFSRMSSKRHIFLANDTSLVPQRDEMK